MAEANVFAAEGWMILKFDHTVPYVLMERELEDDA